MFIHLFLLLVGSSFTSSCIYYKATPNTKVTKPFQPTLTHSQSTIPQPFSFDDKYTSEDEVIEQLVQREEEEPVKVSSDD